VVAWEMKKDAQRGPKASGPVAERFIAFSGRHGSDLKTGFCLKVNEGKEEVGETSLRALSERYGEPGWRSSRGGFCVPMSPKKKGHAESSASQKSLHTPDRHLMAQLLPLQEPCAVKVASDREISIRIWLKGHHASDDRTRLCEAIFSEYIDSVFVFLYRSMVEQSSLL
jgi:hypothetical protein